MARVRRYMNLVNGWEQVVTASEGLPHLAASRAKLQELIDQAKIQSGQQSTFTAMKQQFTKDLKQTLRSGQLLVDVLRTGAREHYGTDNEKLVEFGMQPFRGRPRTSTPSSGGVESVKPADPASLTSTLTPDTTK